MSAITIVWTPGHASLEGNEAVDVVPPAWSYHEHSRKETRSWNGTPTTKPQIHLTQLPPRNETVRLQGHSATAAGKRKRDAEKVKLIHPTHHLRVASILLYSPAALHHASGRVSALDGRRRSCEGRALLACTCRKTFSRSARATATTEKEDTETE